MRLRSQAEEMLSSSPFCKTEALAPLTVDAVVLRAVVCVARHHPQQREQSDPLFPSITMRRNSSVQQEGFSSHILVKATSLKHTEALLLNGRKQPVGPVLVSCRPRNGHQIKPGVFFHLVR